MEFWHLDYLATMLVCLSAIAIGLFGARRFGQDKLRRVAAIDACLEAVSVCAERGGSLYFSPGGLTPLSLGSRPIVSWLPSVQELLKLLAFKAGEAGVRIITVTYNPFARLQMSDFAMQGYIKAGHPELHRDQDHIYFPDYITGMIGGIGIIHTEKPKALIAVGSHAWYSGVSLVEAAVVEGAYTIAGTPYTDDTAGVVIAADYVPLSEEVVAMGAYLADDPTSRSVLVGEDIFKILLLGALLVLTALYGLKIF